MSLNIEPGALSIASAVPKRARAWGAPGATLDQTGGPRLIPDYSGLVRITDAKQQGCQLSLTTVSTRHNYHPASAAAKGIWAFKFGLLAGFDQVFASEKRRRKPSSSTHSLAPSRSLGSVRCWLRECNTSSHRPSPSVHPVLPLLLLLRRQRLLRHPRRCRSPYDGTTNPNPPAGLLWSALWIGAKTCCNQHRNTGTGWAAA